VLSEISLFGEESFSEKSHPTLADAIEFVVEILDDPDAAFNQDLSMDNEDDGGNVDMDDFGEEAEDDVEI
jgi:hypothetical protein